MSQPLNVVQEKAKLERSASQQKPSTSTRPSNFTEAKAPMPDIFGDIPSPSARPSTTDPPNIRSAPAKTATPTKQPEPGNSLLGLDFFGGPPSAVTSKPTSVSSTPSAMTGPSRPDLKQSILSLYASTPRTQNHSQHERQTSFGGMQSPPVQSNAQGGGFGRLDDAFSSLTFSSTTSPPPTVSQPQSNPNPFATLDQPASQRSAFASPPITAPAVKGGGFFNPVSTTAPKAAPTSNPPTKTPQIPLNNILSPGLGDLSLGSSTSSVAQPKPTSTSNLTLFDFAESTPQDAVPKFASTTSSSISSAFNLSSPALTSQGPPKPATSTTSRQNAFPSLSSADPWGSSDAWATPEPSPRVASTTKPADKAPSIATTMDFTSWGGPSSSSNSAPGHSGGASGSNIRAAPKITEDEDFGGWTSAVPVSTVTPKPGPAPSSNAKPASGYSASEDMFSNVWE